MKIENINNGAISVRISLSIKHLVKTNKTSVLVTHSVVQSFVIRET